MTAPIALLLAAATLLALGLVLSIAAMLGLKAGGALAGAWRRLVRP